jgi:hypothetical protein
MAFSNKISAKMKKPDRKFIADITYGILASGSCILTDIADALHEKTRKINTVDRLAKHLGRGAPAKARNSYLNMVRGLAPDNPVIHIDDSDVTKPEGKKFEALGAVRDGSESTASKNVYKKGYHVTEATVLTKTGHPVSFFSRVHSSLEKDFTSVNSITSEAMGLGAKLFKKATYVMDRGYDDNKIFLEMDELGQDYIVRLTKKRKLFYGGKWTMATELMNRRKGKIKMPLIYKGREHDAYLSHVKCKITASRKDIYLVLVYGITKHPMMLATNREIKAKDDVIDVAEKYFSRWRIEEYFRSKKQLFNFEDFRVRKLKAINALNFHITVCMAFLALVAQKPGNSKIKVAIVKKADPLKAKVSFQYYRLAKGIVGILAHARSGVRDWFKTKRPKYRQLRLRLIS